jgi:hypothetical protein
MRAMERSQGLQGPVLLEGGRVGDPNDRRNRRSDNITQALRYLLDACRDSAGLTAMALADRDGLLLATAGEHVACEEVAARIACIPVAVGSFRGTVIGPPGAWQVHMRRLRISELALYVCAIGGTSEDRTRAVARAATGIERILA